MEYFNFVKSKVKEGMKLKNRNRSFKMFKCCFKNKQHLFQHIDKVIKVIKFISK